ncbi:exonuclease domain-containing protein [Actinotalea solisilvae]|uniref:exonuclease domain-containing protein n=1 Tax=Actinotalea solisilvae TaxID=2072922 RepID=UPI0027DB6E79|nr:exonuclease domain-containing protein [Actinotalea solisilvae]
MTTEVTTTATTTAATTTAATTTAAMTTAVPVPWAARPVVGFDTETTGVDVDTDRIVTAAVVRREGGTTTVRTWLLDPGVPIPEAATAIHGITTQRARAAGRPAAPALDEIATALADALAHGEPVVAYNASFDLSLLDVELRRHGLPTLAARLGRPVRAVLDPLVLDRHLDAAREGARRLGDLCGHYGVRTHADLHAADVDVLATLDVLDAIARAYPVLGAMTHDALHDLQADAYARWVAEVVTARAEAGREGPGPEPAWPARGDASVAA